MKNTSFNNSKILKTAQMITAITFAVFFYSQTAAARANIPSIPGGTTGGAVTGSSTGTTMGGGGHDNSTVNQVNAPTKYWSTDKNIYSGTTKDGRKAYAFRDVNVQIVSGVSGSGKATVCATPPTIGVRNGNVLLMDSIYGPKPLGILTVNGDVLVTQDSRLLPSGTGAAKTIKQVKAAASYSGSGTSFHADVAVIASGATKISGEDPVTHHPLSRPSSFQFSPEITDGKVGAGSGDYGVLDLGKVEFKGMMAGGLATNSKMHIQDKSTPPKIIGVNGFSKVEYIFDDNMKQDPPLGFNFDSNIGGLTATLLSTTNEVSSISEETRALGGTNTGTTIADTTRTDATTTTQTTQTTTTAEEPAAVPPPQ